MLGQRTHTYFVLLYFDTNNLTEYMLLLCNLYILTIIIKSCNYTKCVSVRNNIIKKIYTLKRLRRDRYFDNNARVPRSFLREQKWHKMCERAFNLLLYHHRYIIKFFFYAIKNYRSICTENYYY